MPQLAALGELIADLGQMPPGWVLGHMTEIQVLFVLHWRRKREREARRRLGELLGVYWTADSYKGSGGTGGHKERVKELFLPLAAILNPETLYKTLDKTLDRDPGGGSTSGRPPSEFDLASIPLDDYKKLFDETGVPSEGLPPLVRTPAPVKPVTQATPLETKIDLDAIAAIDPELARHLDPNATW